MIKCEKGLVEITGFKSEIMSDLATIVRVLSEASNLTKENIKEATKLGLMDDKELKKYTGEKIKRLTEKLNKDSSINFDKLTEAFQEALENLENNIDKENEKKGDE